MSNFTESVVEETDLAWLKALGYAILSAPGVAAGELRVKQTEKYLEAAQ